MSEHTPTTEQVRSGYASAGAKFLRKNTADSEVEFNRWLAARDVRVSARAWDEAADRIEIDGGQESPITDHLKDVNPYREDR